MKQWRAQTLAELRLLARNGEQLLLTIGIPVLLLVFFSVVDVLPTGEGDAIDFLLPGVLAIALMSTAMVSLGIATGFERSYGVLSGRGSARDALGRTHGARLASHATLALVWLAREGPARRAARDRRAPRSHARARLRRGERALALRTLVVGRRARCCIVGAVARSGGSVRLRPRHRARPRGARTRRRSHSCNVARARCPARGLGAPRLRHLDLGARAPAACARVECESPSGVLRGRDRFQF